MNKKKITLFFWILIFLNCSPYDRTLKYGTKLQEEIYTNTVFASMIYKKYGFWPNSCEQYKSLLPDSVLSKHNEETICNDFFIKSYSKKNHDLFINWELLQITTYYIKSDTLFSFNDSIFSYNDTIYAVVGRRKYTIPIGHLRLFMIR